MAIVSNSVRLVQKIENVDTYEYFCVLKVSADETLSCFRKKIEGVIDFAFDFWDDKLPGRVRETAEKLIGLEELGGTVVVIRREIPIDSSAVDVANTLPVKDVSSVDIVTVKIEKFSWESKLMSVAALKVWEEQV